MPDHVREFDRVEFRVRHHLTLKSMNIRFAMGIMGVVLWLLAPGQAANPEDLQSIVLTEDEHEEQAVVELNGCRVSLDRRKKESHLLHFRDDCQQSLAEKLSLLKIMLETLIPDLINRKTIRTLFVGRLVSTFPDFAQRVAKAASGSPDWDGRRPWKEPGYSNRFVLQLMKEKTVFPELNATLEPLGYEVQIASVEKILMARPKDIPFGNVLLEQGADPNIKLPFDALTWFHLNPIPNISPPSPQNE